MITQFLALWIQFNRNNTDKHQLFLKEHSIRNQLPEHPKGRTLFVLNVPPYVTPNSLQKAFSQICGKVTNVFFVTSKGFKTAYVVFEKETTLEKALELPADFIISLNRKNNLCLAGLESKFFQHSSLFSLVECALIILVIRVV